MAISVVQESHAVADLDRLDQSWRYDSTFLFVPQKSAVDEAWLQRSIAQIPSDLRRGHFGLLTSGSTGEPKLVIGSRARAEQAVEVLHRAQDSEPVARTIAALPLSYSFAFVNQWLWSRVFARELVATGGLGRPDEFLDALRQRTEVMLCLVGSQLPILDSLAGTEVFPGVTRLHFAGGRFPVEQLSRIRARFPAAAVYNNYGCAEALPRLTLRRAVDGVPAENVGAAIEGVELATAANGELLFRSAYGAVGIVEHGHFTRIEPESWTPTGDVGAVGMDGSCVLAGRAGSVFKRHGEKVSAATLVAAIGRAWSGTAITYRDVDALGEPGLVAVLVPSPTAGELGGILRVLRASFSRAQWPLRIEAVATLPLLPNGKPDARAVATSPDRVELWRQRI